MAIYHLSVKPVARSTGRSATAAAAYRAGAAIACEREGRLHDYSRKQGIAHTEIIVPDGAVWASDRAALWNAAEAAECRVNSTVAREYELALPAELSARGRVALVRAFGEELRDRYGVAADIAIHAPHRDGDQRNWHAHVLTTTRTVEAEGLGVKTRILDDRKTGPAQVVELRAAWAELSNRFLEQERFAERVDHRSLAAIRDGRREEGRAHAAVGRVEEAKDAFAAALGADRPAQVHMGPAASAMERRAAREAGDKGRGYEPVTRIGAEVLRARQFAAATRDYLCAWTLYARTRIEQAGARLEAAFTRIKERFRAPEEGTGVRERERDSARPAPASPTEGRSFLERRGEEAQPRAPDRPKESFLARRAAAPAHDNPAGRNADAMEAARARMADTLSKISEHLPAGPERAEFEKQARALLERADEATKAQRQIEQVKDGETPAPSKELSAAERQRQIDIENRDRIERELLQRDRSEGRER